MINGHDNLELVEVAANGKHRNGQQLRPKTDELLVRSHVPSPFCKRPLSFVVANDRDTISCLDTPASSERHTSDTHEELFPVAHLKTASIIFWQETVKFQLHDECTLRELALMCGVNVAIAIRTPRQLGNLLLKAGYVVDPGRLEGDEITVFDELIHILSQVQDASLYSWDGPLHAVLSDRHAQSLLLDCNNPRPIAYRMRPASIVFSKALVAAPSLGNSESELSTAMPFKVGLSSQVDMKEQATANRNTEIRIAQSCNFTLDDGTIFLLGNCIGIGHHGAVYRALDTRSGSLVAIKRIHLQEHSIEERTKIMQEVALLRKLKSPWIVQFMGCVQDDEFLSIATEYIEGGSLLSVMNSFGKISETLAASFTWDIIQGLLYLHAEDVVHCDLKCANVLLSKTGSIRLADFGVAICLAGQTTFKGDVIGSPNWLAPEVITLHGTSKASDIWSLGCTIIEMLQAKPPYANQNPMSVLYAVVEDGPPTFPDSSSRHLTDLLKQCFQREPRARPSATVLQHHAWVQHASSQEGATLATSKAIDADQHVSRLNRPPMVVKIQTQAENWHTVTTVVDEVYGHLGKHSSVAAHPKKQMWYKVGDRSKKHPNLHDQDACQGDSVLCNASNITLVANHAHAKRKAPNLCCTRSRLVVRRKTSKRVIKECCIM